MKNLFRILFHWQDYKYWKKRKAGVETRDRSKGPGYYFPTGLIFQNSIGRIEEWKMTSGEIGIHKLVDYRCYDDPPDMIKISHWQFLGYKGVKPINDCTFAEFLKLYCK